MPQDIFSTKDEKSSKFYLQIKKNIVFSFQGWLYFCEILLDFGLHASILATLSLWGETGSKPKKRSI